MSGPVIDRSAARAALIAKYTDPEVQPFPGAIRTYCGTCLTFMVWSNPPACTAPTVCTSCAALKS